MKIVSNMGALKRIAAALEDIAAELHKLNASKNAKKPREYKGKRAWKRGEESSMIEWRKAGWDYNHIAKALGRTPSACSAHYWALTKRNKK